MIEKFNETETKGILSKYEGIPVEQIPSDINFRQLSLKPDETLIISYPLDEEDHESKYDFNTLVKIFNMVKEAFPCNTIILAPELNYGKIGAEYNEQIHRSLDDNM